MREAPNVTNVVETCTLAGRQERLDALLEQLELCEKALQVPVPLDMCIRFLSALFFWKCQPAASPDHKHTELRCSCTCYSKEREEDASVAQDYLETKRIAFPRFYFVAPADLIDILSKGSDPQAILR